MKKILILVLIMVMIIGTTANVLASSCTEVSGGYAFSILDRSYEDAEEDFLIYYHSGCSQSMKIMPFVKKYAEDNNLKLYITDYRKGKLPGAGEYVGSIVIKFPIAIAYSHKINAIHGINGIASEQQFKNFADNFFSQKNPEIKITIGADHMFCNGKKIKLDVPAQIVNNRTLVPLRAIAEAYNFNVQWDGKSNQIIAKKYATEISLYTNKTYLLIGNIKNDMYTKPLVVNGRTLISVRALAETLGADVKWNEATKTATIK